jgi:uncharacterized iron-regulated membrane protein
MMLSDTRWNWGARIKEGGNHESAGILSLLVVAVAVAGLTGTPFAGLQFHAAYSTALPDAPVSFRIADLNNDSLPMRSRSGQYDAISILLGNGEEP